MKYIITTESLDYCTDGNVESMITNINICAELTNRELAERMIDYCKSKKMDVKLHQVLSDEDVERMLNEKKQS